MTSGSSGKQGEGAAGLQLAAGVDLHRAGRLDEAEAIYRAVLKAQPKNLKALELLATISAQRGRLDQAIEAFGRLLRIDPANVAALANMGAALLLRGDVTGALDASGRGLAVPSLTVEAKASLLTTRGGALRALGRGEEALAVYAGVATLQPGLAEAHFNIGSVEFDLQRYERARVSLERAIALRPDYPFARGSALGAAMRVCQWQEYEGKLADLKAAIRAGKTASLPFESLLLEEAALQKRAAEIWARAQHPEQPSPIWRARDGDARIRLGYFSGDVRNHATMHLAAGLLEQHDRDRFHLTLFVFGPVARDAMTERVEAAFDEVIDVRALSDAEAARLARAKAIDIAVDMKGASTDHRLGIFAHRAAPVQVNYLAYPGTVGTSYLDYIIADDVLIPETHLRFFAEKVVVLPGSYQANDAARPLSDRVFTRADCGLPETEFVFCCFNAAYKITPDVFDVWMRLLHARPGAVLWLFADNDGAVANLKREAEARGVDARRLVFAPLLPAAEHLARLALADLFLDTFPINAHTTASDALWAGVPVLTHAGEAFASRVAASLLTALGLDELIVGTREAYEAEALRLSGDGAAVGALKAKLQAARVTSSLFDTALYARGIEAAFTHMHHRHMAGLPPENFTAS